MAILGVVLLFAGYVAAVAGVYFNPLFTLLTPLLTWAGIRHDYNQHRREMSRPRAMGAAATVSAACLGPAALVTWLVAADPILPGVGPAEVVAVFYTILAVVFGVTAGVSALGVLLDVI